jgi:transglutaminase-like putative cysteine protease
MTHWLNQSLTPSAIDRYFQVSLYLLIVTGFVTLASTGKLDAPALLLVSLALLYRGYLLIRGRTLQLPDRWASYLTLVYAVFYLCDLFILSGNFVSATVHLVLFIMVVKIFSTQRDRDHVYLAIISFLSVLAAAVLTVDAVFFASFCVFLLLVASTFISMEVRRSSSRAAASSRTPPSGRQRLTGSLSTTALALALGTALCASLIFFIMPRLSAGYLSAYAPRNALVSGFSDEVRLGEIGQIQQADTVVMHVQIDGDTRGAHDLKWRGVALRVFDGTRWSNPQQQATALNNPEGYFDLSTTRAATVSSVSQHLVHYRALMEPVGANVFFLAPRPKSLSGNYRLITVDEGGAVYNGDREHAIGSYRAVSDVGQPSPEELRRATAEVPPRVAIQYLQLPPLDQRLPQLARDITASAPTAYDKALAVEHYLQTNYGYTLQLPRVPQRDPVADFLFQRKAGHCEYFASSMALMLRTLEIPARVVNGFRGGEFNSLTGSYIVRSRDAHSWVEAYFPHYGWIAFDPTPAAGAAALGISSRAGLYLDALREFWREWVVNYDFAHQVSLSNNAAVRSRRLFDGVRLWTHQRYAELLERTRHVERRAEESPRRYGGIGLGVIALAILVLNLGRLRAAVRVRRLVRNPASAPQAAASIWYARMLRSLGRRGWRKLPEHTPSEFVRTIGDPKLRGPVAAFTDRYERARFGNSADDAQALPAIFEEIRRA